MLTLIVTERGCIQKFCQRGGGGANLGNGQKRGGTEAYVGCYTLHLLVGGENDTGANAPPRPLKYSISH